MNGDDIMSLTFPWRADPDRIAGSPTRIVRFRKYTASYNVHEGHKMTVILHRDAIPCPISVAVILVDLPSSCTVKEADQLATESILQWMVERPDRFEELRAEVYPFIVNSESELRITYPVQDVFVDASGPGRVLHADQHDHEYQTGDIITIQGVRYIVRHTITYYTKDQEVLSYLCVVSQIQKRPDPTYDSEKSRDFQTIIQPL